MVETRIGTRPEGLPNVRDSAGLMENGRRAPMDALPQSLLLPGIVLAEAQKIGQANHPGASGINLDPRGNIVIGGMLGLQPGRYVAEISRPHFLMVQRSESPSPSSHEIAAFFTRPERRGLILDGAQMTVLVPTLETKAPVDIEKRVQKLLKIMPGSNKQFAYAKELGTEAISDAMLHLLNIAIYRGKKDEHLLQVKPQNSFSSNS